MPSLLSIACFIYKVNKNIISERTRIILFPCKGGLTGKLHLVVHQHVPYVKGIILLTLVFGQAEKGDFSFWCNTYKMQSVEWVRKVKEENAGLTRFQRWQKLEKITKKNWKWHCMTFAIEIVPRCKNLQGRWWESRVRGMESSRLRPCTCVSLPNSNPDQDFSCALHHNA